MKGGIEKQNVPVKLYMPLDVNIPNFYQNVTWSYGSLIYTIGLKIILIKGS